MLNLKGKAELYAFLTVLLWASAFVLTKISLLHFNVAGIAVLRYVTASITLILIGGVKKIGLPKLADVPGFILAGAAGIALYVLAFNKGSETLSAAAGSVIVATAPIITAMAANLIFKEKIRPAGWAAIAVGFSGILILMLWDGVFSINKGAWYMIAAACLISAYNLLQRKYTKKYTALQTTTYSIIGGTLLLLPFLPQGISQIMTAPPAQLGILLYMGVFPSALAYMWWAKAFSLAGSTSTVTNFMFVTPLLSTVMGYFIIMELPPVSTVVGGCMILLGLALFNWKGRQ